VGRVLSSLVSHRGIGLFLRVCRVGTDPGGTQNRPRIDPGLTQNRPRIPACGWLMHHLALHSAPSSRSMSVSLIFLSTIFLSLFLILHGSALTSWSGEAQGVRALCSLRVPGEGQDNLLPSPSGRGAGGEGLLVRNVIDFFLAAFAFPDSPVFRPVFACFRLVPRAGAEQDASRIGVGSE